MEKLQKFAGIIMALIMMAVTFVVWLGIILGRGIRAVARHFVFGLSVEAKCVAAAALVGAFLATLSVRGHHTAGIVPTDPVVYWTATYGMVVIAGAVVAYIAYVLRQPVQPTADVSLLYVRRP